MVGIVEDEVDAEVEAIDVVEAAGADEVVGAEVVVVAVVVGVAELVGVDEMVGIDMIVVGAEAVVVDVEDFIETAAAPMIITMTITTIAITIILLIPKRVFLIFPFTTHSAQAQSIF